MSEETCWKQFKIVLAVFCSNLSMSSKIRNKGKMQFFVRFEPRKFTENRIKCSKM
jgi:hypothetical protein